MPVRILIADDHEIVREALCSRVRRNADWEVCGEAGDGREAVALAERLRPDIVIMDINMPNLNGLDATRQIKRILPKTEVLIFTANETEEIVRDVFKAGARSYLLKLEANTHLAPAIEALCMHRTYFSSRVSEIVFSGYLKGDAHVEDRSLTPRERELVQLVAEGRSNKETAAVLGISVKTVETHRAAVMRKLNLGSIADLVRYAIRNGIVAA
jgi:DNA-binding NarL/FixJ family response regulator